MILIENFIDHLEYPKMNGIVFPNGEIQLLEIYDSPTFEVSLLERVWLEQLSQAGNLNWNSAALLGRLISPDKSLEVVFGEADYGSDGFVALIDASTQKLVWLAAFDCSNPFELAEFKDNTVLARSTLGKTWVFPIGTPSSISVM